MTSVKVPLDPVIAEMVRRTKESGIPDLYAGCLESHGGPVSRERGRNLRAFFYPKPTLPTGKIESLRIDGNAFGVNAQIPVRIHWPEASFVSGSVLNTLVYFHGGGFVVGDLDSHDAHAIRLANEAQCVVVNVDYRLAPENRFPAAYEDCWAVTQWVAQNISRLGRRLNRLAVGGDSAGGNLAAAVALACRDSGLSLSAQLLLYPATDLTQLNGMPEQAYLGLENIQTTGCDWRASPKLAASHVGLAPAILAVGAHDFLYRDNQAYLQVLRDAKVPLTYREFPTLNHGFFSFTAISADSQAAAQLICADLKTYFENAE